MKYDYVLWDKYTEDNENNFQEKVVEFIFHISLIFGARRILEVGCNVGNNLKSFPPYYDVHGLDLNKKALAKAKRSFPDFKFEEGSILKMPYDDAYFDLVFTRGVLIHIPKSDMPLAISELLRVSKKWICNMEYFGEDGKMIKWRRGDNLLWYRDMKKWWSNQNVEIISEIDLPLELDKEKIRLIIIKKN